MSIRCHRCGQHSRQRDGQVPDWHLWKHNLYSCVERGQHLHGHTQRRWANRYKRIGSHRHRHRVVRRVRHRLRPWGSCTV